jgi:hypothetical protein
MFETAGSYFHHLWNSELNDGEREALRDIAYEKPLAVKSDQVIKSLIRKEILAANKNSKDSYVFRVPVFKEWIIKYG